MKIEIEVYKGQSISYDEDWDKFECEIELNSNVKKSKRGSLKDLKKDIDLFIKANLDFKPFKFLKKSDYGSKTFEPYYCSAIRTDGTFVVNAIGSERKSYFGRKEMKSAMIYDEEINKKNEQIEKEYRDAYKKSNEEKEVLYDKLIPLDISSYDSFLNQDN